MAKHAPSPAAVLAAHWTLIAIASAMVSARLYLRLGLKEGRLLLVSDLLMFTAWCAAATTASFDIVIYKMGALRPDVDYTLRNFNASPADFEYVLRMLWAGAIPFYVALYLCKASLLAVYVRLFPTFMFKLRIALWATVGYCVVAFIVSISLQLFLCWPIQRNWQITNPEVTCSVDVVILIFQVGWALHFTGSVLVFTLPFFMIWNLQMCKRMKAGVYAVLLLGAVDIAFSLARFLTIQLGGDLESRAITLIALWSALDLNMGLIVACLPSLRPYLRRNTRSTISHSLGYIRTTTERATIASHCRERHQFEGLSESNAGAQILVDRDEKGSELGGTTASVDLPGLGPYNDDKSSDILLIELNTA